MGKNGKIRNNVKKQDAITLIALVITIIILLVLSGITVKLALREDGVIQYTQLAKEEDRKQKASETMQLKITNLQMENYAKHKSLPSLQELADGLCEDSEMEYVLLTSQKLANLDKIEVGQNKSIFTKLKKYPYEFEINSSLQLASIDGIKIANNPETITIEKQEYEEMKNKISKLSNKSAITVSSSGEYEVNANEKKVVFDKIDSSVGMGLTIEDGGIKIGKGIEYVLVSAYCDVNSKDGITYSLTIKVNEETKFSCQNRAAGPSTGVSTATYMLQVNEGDIVYVYNANPSVGGTMINNVLSIIEY